MCVGGGGAAEISMGSGGGGGMVPPRYPPVAPLGASFLSLAPRPDPNQPPPALPPPPPLASCSSRSSESWRPLEGEVSKDSSTIMHSTLGTA